MLAGLSLASDMPPALLLTFTFLLGAGAAVSMPPWQALIPDIVPRHEVRAAAALGAVSMNLARAVGPALAGFLITQFPVGSRLRAQRGVLRRDGGRAAPVGTARAACPATSRSGSSPRCGPGARYVRHSQVVRRLLLRSALFVLPGTALWALLPLVATQRLGLGSGGYGLLLAALGIGAVAGAVVLPRVADGCPPASWCSSPASSTPRRRSASSWSRTSRWSSRSCCPRAPPGSRCSPPSAPPPRSSCPAGSAPEGCRCSRSCSWAGRRSAPSSGGCVAQYTGLVVAFVVASALMALGAATIAVLPLHDTAGLDRTPALYWPEPQLVTEPDPDEGPVLITLTFTVPPANVARFLEAMTHVSASRQPNRRFAVEPLPRRGRPLPLHRDLLRPVLGGTPAPTPRPPHRRGPGPRARSADPRRRTTPDRPPIPRPRQSLEGDPSLGGHRR